MRLEYYYKRINNGGYLILENITRSRSVFYRLFRANAKVKTKTCFVVGRLQNLLKNSIAKSIHKTSSNIHTVAISNFLLANAVTLKIDLDIYFFVQTFRYFGSDIRFLLGINRSFTCSTENHEFFMLVSLQAFS